MRRRGGAGINNLPLSSPSRTYTLHHHIVTLSLPLSSPSWTYTLHHHFVTLSLQISSQSLPFTHCIVTLSHPLSSPSWTYTLHHHCDTVTMNIFPITAFHKLYCGTITTTICSITDFHSTQPLCTGGYRGCVFQPAANPSDPVRSSNKVLVCKLPCPLRLFQIFGLCWHHQL